MFAIRSDSRSISTVGTLSNDIGRRRLGDDLAVLDVSPAVARSPADGDGKGKVASTV